MSRPNISSVTDTSVIQEEAAAGEWAALLAKEDDEVKNTDGITAETLNEVNISSVLVCQICLSCQTWLGSKCL